jgi:hypothetical protein
MLAECARGSVVTPSKHSLIAKFKGKTAAIPKGEGVPPDARPERFSGVMVFPQYARKPAQMFELDKDCVNRFFPGLLK